MRRGPENHLHDDGTAYARPSSDDSSVPSKVICPSVIGTSLKIERPRVDLPLPDSPTSPSTSPR